MRILLQQKKTGLFFGNVGEWVSGSFEAMDFVSSSRAIQFCVANRLSGVQLVFKFEDQPYEIVCQMTSVARASVPASPPPPSM